VFTFGSRGCCGKSSRQTTRAHLSFFRGIRIVSYHSHTHPSATCLLLEGGVRLSTSWLCDRHADAFLCFFDVSISLTPSLSMFLLLFLTHSLTHSFLPFFLSSHTPFLSLHHSYAQISLSSPEYVLSNPHPPTSRSGDKSARIWRYTSE